MEAGAAAEPSGRRRAGYGVKLVRGPFVRPQAHPDATDDPGELRRLARETTQPIAVDLFCGAGGLSLGLEQAGFRVLVGIDHDAEALETHRSLFAGLTLQWDLGDDDILAATISLLRGIKPALIAGGPPCQPFSRAGRSLVRHLIATGRHDPHADKRDLWQSFLAVVAGVRPPAVLMENVPDLALGRDMMILRTMVDELEALGYRVETQLVDAWRHGVPQHRQRLILVALANGTDFEWPADLSRRTTVDNAIGDLPPVEGGWRPEGGADGWAAYSGPRTSFQKRMRAAVGTEGSDRVYDHITRPVRADDLLIFEQMDHNTLYSEIDPALQRYRTDSFDDKYNRLDANALSRSITAHIAKDGYWYIHPSQNRTITVREAARLQTFPDHVRFAGPPSAAFRQIGNAVPPLMAERIGRAILESLTDPRPSQSRTTDTAERLARWFDEREELTIPWLRARTRWQVLLGDLLLARARTEVIRSVWPLVEPLSGPGTTLAHRERLIEIGTWLNRSDRVSKILAAAEWFVENPTAFDSAAAMAKAPFIFQAQADLAVRVLPDDTDDPVLTGYGALRPAARFVGRSVDRMNKLSDGRMTVARMIGVEPLSDRSHPALLELANSLCRPEDPVCAECPLREECDFAGRDDRQQLF